jgi:probable phosphoglycerate mutase
MTNLLINKTQLNNTYAVMRHGQSTANQQNIILSFAQHGINDYGLSALGKQQVLDSIARSTQLNAKAKIITSDFKRARESAEIVHQFLSTKTKLSADPRLRERRFGQLEFQDTLHYKKIWALDEHDSSHHEFDVESCDEVTHRVTSMICELEENHNQDYFLLVAHGDILQMLETAFDKKPASTHRQLTHLDTAQIRQLKLNTL